MNDSVYYRLYLNRDEQITVVCIQSFDEDGYYSHRFVKDESGPLKFEKEQDAIDYLNENFRLLSIDPEYRSPANDFF